MDFPFVLPYNKRNYSPQGKRRTTMLYPIMNRSRSLIDLGGIWHFKLGDETEPEDTWSAPQEMDLIAEMIAMVIRDEKNVEQVKEMVQKLTEKYPLC